MVDILKNVQSNIKEVCDYLGYDDNVYESLVKPNKIIQVNFPVQMDDGSLKVFTGYRSQHNNKLGPYKGGLRFHQIVDEQEVIALSIWMTLKCSIVGLPYGGGKGGVEVNPKDLSDNEIERLTRAFTRAIYENIGEYKDIMAPDINTDSRIMSYIVDEYEKILGEECKAIVTGKPVYQGGSLGREKATGFGVSKVAVKMLEKNNIIKTEAKVAIQGFGNVGSNTCLSMFEEGIKIVAIAGHYNGELYAIYSEEGLNIPKIIEFRKQEKDLRKIAGVKVIDIDDFWSLDLDILIPAAMENAIDSRIANLINSKMIIEAANGPIMDEADKVLEQRDILVIPDILANSGGVIVSYFEWVQNLNNESWSEEKVLKEEEKKLENSLDLLFEYKLKNSELTFRKLAYIIAINKIVNEK